MRARSKKEEQDYRAKEIDRKVAEVIETLESKGNLFSSDIQLKKFMADMVMPVITVAKENMVTNVYKNNLLNEIQENLMDVQ